MHIDNNLFYLGYHINLLLHLSFLNVIFTLLWHSPAMNHKKVVANIFQWKTLVTWRKIDIDFLDFLGIFHRFSINIRIEVHFLSFSCKRKKSVLQSLNKSKLNTCTCICLFTCKKCFKWRIVQKTFRKMITVLQILPQLECWIGEQCKELRHLSEWVSISIWHSRCRHWRKENNDEKIEMAFHSSYRCINDWCNGSLLVFYQIMM